jgi:uncharacterized protein
METVIADTGFVVSLANRSDAKHEIVKATYLQHQRIFLPQTVLAEVAYLIGREAGVITVASFLKGLPMSRFSLLALLDEGILRVAEILDRYADSRIDFAEASVMAVAERLSIVTVLTLDRQDFSLFRPRHCDGFVLIP